jgi:formiminoglutamase
VQQARQYVNLSAAHAKVAYLHICEGAAQLSTGQANELIGKTIGFLLSDFIKMHNSVKA